MSDVFSVTASWSAASYTAGQTMVGTITGTNAHTAADTVTHQTSGPVTIPVTATPSGAGSTITLAGVDVATTVPGATTVENVVIDAALFVASQGGRTWTVSTDGKSISATA